MDYTFSEQEDKEFQRIFYFAEKLYSNTPILSEEMTIAYNNHRHSHPISDEENSSNNKFIVTLDSISEPPISEEALSTLYLYEKECQRKANEELEQSKKRTITEVSSSTINTESNEYASNIDEQPKTKIVLTEEQKKY